MNPLRSEADAFRWVVIIGAGAAAVIAVTLAVGSEFGIVLAAALIGFGIGRAWRPRARARDGEPGLDDSGADRRVLVVADETLAVDALVEELANRCRGRRGEVLVVTPALSAQFKSPEAEVDGLSDLDERRERAVSAAQAAGLDARGMVGDADPNAALREALGSFAADELIVWTAAAGRSRWLELGIVERVRREVELPITHLSPPR